MLDNFYGHDLSDPPLQSRCFVPIYMTSFDYVNNESRASVFRQSPILDEGSSACKEKFLHSNDEENASNSITSSTMDTKSVQISITSPDHIYLGKRKDVVRLLCFDLTNSSKFVQFFACSAGVFFCYLIYGYMQELIFRLPGFQPFGWYLTLVQFAFYTGLAVGEQKIRRESGRKIPFVKYMQLAFYTVATMGFSNASVGYLNYPTQVIFKCCKLIPVLIGGILIQGKRQNAIDFFAAACMSVGLILFTLADSSVSPNFNISGYVMICSALVADAVIGNVQEKEMKSHSATNTEVVLYSYSVGFVYILVGTLITGELFDGFVFFAHHPVETYGYAVIFSAAGYFGVNVVLTLVKSFGAFIAVTVTTCRKAVTIILSFILFAKPFTFQYVWSGGIVLFGIYLNVYSKNSQQWNDYFIRMIQRVISFIQKFRLRRKDQLLESV